MCVHPRPQLIWEVDPKLEAGRTFVPFGGEGTRVKGAKLKFYLEEESIYGGYMCDCGEETYGIDPSLYLNGMGWEMLEGFEDTLIDKTAGIQIQMYVCTSIYKGGAKEATKTKTAPLLIAVRNLARFKPSRHRTMPRGFLLETAHFGGLHLRRSSAFCFTLFPPM